MHTTSYEPLRNHLQDWVGIYVAQFHLARCLGILGAEYPDLISAKSIFWSNSPTGNICYRVLCDLAKIGFVEIDEEELKVRWKSDQPSEKPK